MIVNISDFTGKYQLSTGMYDTVKLQDYINKYEKRYLIELFGANLYTEFESDIASNAPQSPNFQKVFYPFYENLTFRQLIISDGIKEMLKGFIYFEYSKDLINQMTPYGNVRPISENSEPVSTLYSMIYARYNEAIRSYKAIQTYIQVNMNAVTGQVVMIEQISGGTNYVTASNVATIGSFGSNLTLDVFTDMGIVESAAINEIGSNYQLNEVVTILDGDANATYKIIYIGKGHFNTFNGFQKQTAYWI